MWDYSVSQSARQYEAEKMQEQLNLERMIEKESAQKRLLQEQEETTFREKSFEDAIEEQLRQDSQQDERLMSLENQTQRVANTSLTAEWRCQVQREESINESVQAAELDAKQIAAESLIEQKELTLLQAQERAAAIEESAADQSSEASMVSKAEINQIRDADMSKASQINREKSASSAERRSHSAEVKRQAQQKNASFSASFTSKGPVGHTTAETFLAEDDLQNSFSAKPDGVSHTGQKATSQDINHEGKTQEREGSASQSKNDSSGNKDQFKRDGTGTAPNSQDDMAAFFNTRHDYRDDTPSLWQRLSYGGQSESFQNQEYQSNNNSAAEYNVVALGQTLTPRLIELIQKLSSMGYNWARVVVPIDAQTKVVVRFNSQNGKVKIHLSAPTSGLCELIQSLWADLTQQVSRHGITLESPTFDTTPEASTYEH